MKRFTKAAGILAMSGMILVGVLSCQGNSNSASMKSNSILFYVGSGDGKLEQPIFLCELNTETMELKLIDSYTADGGAGYLDFSPDGKTLYATSGTSVPGDQGNNSVAAFRVLEDHTLELINKQSSMGRGNCHVQTSPQGDYVFAANYSSGSATALPVGEGGKLLEPTSVVTGEGSGPNQNRQKGPHAHQVMMDLDGKYLLVPDLGTDKVMNYILDRENGKLTPNPAQEFLTMEPGSGPRHLAFGPSGEFVYILNELSATVVACNFNKSNGKLSPINTASIVEEGFNGNRQSAAIRVHPNGDFVYATNRDDASNLAVFAKTKSGGLKRTQLVNDVPYWPREFNISPDGKYLLVAGGRANEIALYSVDSQTGKVMKQDAVLSLPNPITIVFIP